jgi:hypothetical protein
VIVNRFREILKYKIRVETLFSQRMRVVSKGWSDFTDLEDAGNICLTVFAARLNDTTLRITNSNVTGGFPS